MTDYFTHLMMLIIYMYVVFKKGICVAVRLLEVSAIAHIICDAGVTPQRVETELIRVSSSTLIDVLCGTIDAKGEASGGALLEYLGAYTFFLNSFQCLSHSHTYTRNSMCAFSLSLLFCFLLKQTSAVVGQRRLCVRISIRSMRALRRG